MKIKIYRTLVVTSLFLSGCAGDQIRAFQAQMDNGLRTPEIVVDPSLKDAEFRNLSFERFVPAQTVGDMIFTSANRGGYVVKGTMTYKKSCGFPLSLKANFFASDGKLLVEGIGSSGSLTMMSFSKYDKGTDTPFFVRSGSSLADNIGKVVIKSVSCG